MAGETIDKLIIQIKSDVSSAVSGIDKVDRKMDGLETNTRNSATSVNTSTTSMSKSFGALKVAAVAAAAAAVAAIWLAGKQALSTSADMEQYMITLSTLYRSQEKAADQLQWILKFAKETPFEISGLVDSTIKLKAFGLEAQDVLETLGDTAAATSKPIDQVVNAFGRLSVGDTGQAVMMFRDIGVNMKNIQGLEWDAQGSLVTPVEEALPLVQKYLDTEFGGLMVKQAESFRGIGSNIKDTMSQAAIGFMGFDEATAEFREGSLFDRVKDSIAGLLNSLSGFDATGAGKTIEEYLKKWDGFKTQLEPARQALASAFGSVKGIIADFREGISGADVDFSFLATTINLVATAISKVLGLVDKSNIGELLGKGIKASIEGYSKLYNAIVDFIVGGINLAIDSYNALVPVLQAAGMDVEKANRINFENMTATVEEEMQKQVDAVTEGNRDIQNTTGAGTTGTGTETDTTATSADIPGWAGHGDYIRSQLATNGAKNIGDLLNPDTQSTVTSQIQTPTASAGTSGEQSGQDEQSGWKEISTKLDQLISAIKAEPRKVDVDMDIDIENHSDVSDLETTLARSVAAGVHGKRIKAVG